MNNKVSEANPQRRRKPWQAGILSLILPGLGQIYNGEVKKGFLYCCLMWVSIVLALIVYMELSFPPFNNAVIPLIILSTYLYVLSDAVRVAQGKTHMFNRKSYTLYFFLIAWLISGFVVQPTMRRVVVEAFKIPAGSMEDTLLVGDHILVNKFLHQFADPKQFDVILFRYPWDEERNLIFIKRVIALPGDTLEVRNRQVYVNGEALEEESYLHQAASLGHDNFGPIIVPRQGDTVEIREGQDLYLNGQRVSIPSGTFFPLDHGQPMDGFQVFYGPLFGAGKTSRQSVGPLTVAHDYYFVLGDNRGNSRDSRFWGFVEDSQILGLAKRIYWSWDHRATQVRWDRIGQTVR